MHSELIGYVGVDSGQLLLCDPCYIDSEWKQENFQDIRIYQHKTTGDKLQYMVDFPNYATVIAKYGLTMNELNETGEWEELDIPVKPKHNFSYNACSQATLSKNGHGQLDYNMGHPGVGVAFRTAWGDGVYPVYAIYGDDNSLAKVEVRFSDDLDEDE